MGFLLTMAHMVLEAVAGVVLTPSACDFRNGRGKAGRCQQRSANLPRPRHGILLMQVKWPNGIEYDGEWKAVNVSVCVSVYIYTDRSTYVDIHICTYIHIYIYIYTDMHMYTCVCVYIYICIHTYTYADVHIHISST